MGQVKLYGLPETPEWPTLAPYLRFQEYSRDQRRNGSFRFRIELDPRAPRAIQWLALSVVCDCAGRCGKPNHPFRRRLGGDSIYVHTCHGHEENIVCSRRRARGEAEYDRVRRLAEAIQGNRPYTPDAPGLF